MVDARGLSCPTPVLMCKKELANNSKFDIIVDNETAKGNIIRFASNNGCEVSFKEENGDYILSIERK